MLYHRRIVALVTLLAPLAAARAPVAVYHDRQLAATPTPAETALAHAVASLVVGPDGDEPALDPSLVDAARRLAEESASAREALTDAGVSDAFAIPVRYTALDGGEVLAPIRTLLRTDVARNAPTHFGVGLAGPAGSQRIGLVFVRRRASLSRFPRHFTVGDRFLLNGTLDGDLKDPLVLVSTPGGRVRELRPRFEHHVFWTLVPFTEGHGRYTIEVQATDRYGTQVLNLLEVAASDVGEPAATPVVRLQPEPQPVASPSEAEERAMALVNRSRKQARLPALEPSAALREEARTHSRDMAERGFFGHNSPTRGGLGQRLRSIGLGDMLARENIAIAASPEIAHSELLRSPSHLRNILDPDVTHLGVGVHRKGSGAQPVYTFTEVFAKLR